jgi:hypothetical protein
MSSKTVVMTAWCGLLQGPPKRRDPSVTERQICAATDLRSDGGTQAWSHAFNNGGKHPHPTEVRLQSRSDSGRLGSGPAADLGGATSTYINSRRFLLPRRLDLGLVGSDLFEDFFIFKN